jgi:predicted tellurium resistance membrane protein TerC
MISKTMKRVPNIIFLGAGFLGFLAGGLLVEDPAIKNFIGDDDDNAMKTARVIFEAIGIAAVLLVGTILRKI